MSTGGGEHLMVLLAVRQQLRLVLAHALCSPAPSAARDSLPPKRLCLSLPQPFSASSRSSALGLQLMPSPPSLHPVPPLNTPFQTGRRGRAAGRRCRSAMPAQAASRPPLAAGRWCKQGGHKKQHWLPPSTLHQPSERERVSPGLATPGQMCWEPSPSTSACCLRARAAQRGRACCACSPPAPAPRWRRPAGSGTADAPPAGCTLPPAIFSDAAAAFALRKAPGACSGQVQSWQVAGRQR